jgi:hypothetical protein
MWPLADTFRCQSQDVAQFIETNNLALIRLMRETRDLLRPGGRFITMAISFGRLRREAAIGHPRLEVFADAFGLLRGPSPLRA